jgi:tetratricopeptide (TPR) repeat protein
VKQKFGLRQTIILLTLLALLLAPTPLAGVLDLESASRSLAAQDYAAAAEALARAARRIPWRGDLWGQAGQAAWQAGDPQQAIHWFAEGEARRALTLANWIAYGEAFQALGNMEAAIRAWEQSVEQFGPSADAERNLAQAHRLAGDYQASLASLQQALALAPQDAKAHFELGLLLTATSPQEALPELMQAASLDPALEEPSQFLRLELNRASLMDEPAYQFLMAGRALAALGHWDLAAEAFRRAVEADMEYAEAWAWLGEARQQTGLSGRPQLDRALFLNPASASVQALDGLYWLRQGQPEKAMLACSKAAALEPENPAWQVALGNAAYAAGEFTQAIEAYQRAVELDPDNLSAWQGLAIVSVNNGADVEETGRMAARQLLRLAPDDWLTYDIAGRMAFLLYAQEEAKKDFLKAIELAPDQPAPHLHLALAYLEFGEAAKAYDKLMDAVQLDPEGDYGWQARRLLEQYFP